MQKELWVRTTKEISDYRAALAKEQKGKDPILDEPLRKPCLDHDHFEGRCRGVLSQCVNTFEGQVLKAWMKYVSDYTDTSLSEALRNLADYLEQDNSSKPFHGKIIDELKSAMRRMTKETIARRGKEDLGITIPAELDKASAIGLYLNVFVKLLEEGDSFGNKDSHTKVLLQELEG